MRRSHGSRSIFSSGSASLPPCPPKRPRVNVDALPMSRLGKDIVRAAQEYGVLVVDTSDGVALSAAAGKAEKAKTGVDPWDDLLQGKNPMEGFPWDQVEFLPPGWGAPTTKQHHR